MSEFCNFLRKVKQFFTVLVWALLLVLLWVLCIQTLHGQTVPLIRVKHDAFVSYYDQQLKNPVLVCYVLEHRHFSGSNKVSGRHFKADTQLPKPRVLDKDYTGSGYVRGHLCSAGDRDSDKAWLKQTYLTSNLVPMTMYCNSGPWKVIEDSCRALAMAGHRLLLARGPLYQKTATGSPHVLHAAVCVTVPDAFFCFGKCLDCGMVLFLWCSNVGTTQAANVVQFGSADLQDVIQTRSGSPQDVTQNVAERSLLEQQRITRQDPVAPLFVRDERISVLLINLIGLWSREVYETITR